MGEQRVLSTIIKVPNKVRGEIKKEEIIEILGVFKIVQLQFGVS